MSETSNTGQKQRLPVSSVAGTGNSDVPVQAKVLILLNPKAGGGLAEDEIKIDIETALLALTEQDNNLRTYKDQLEFFTGSAEAFQQKLNQSAGQYNRILAAGGDGTVTCAITAALPFPHLKIGILPMGTGNRLASTLGIPTDVHAALHIALTGRVRMMDLLSVNDQICTLALDAGAGAAMVERANKQPWLKRILGILAYPLVALDLIVNSRVIPFKLKVSGDEKIIPAVGVAVVNGGDIGGYSITPYAKNDDGLFDVAILAANNRRLHAIAQILQKTAGSIHEESGLLNFQTNELVIDTADGKPVPVEIDGDVNGQTTPVHIRMAGKIPILVAADA